MKNTKKIISLLLSILMIITSIPLMAVNSFAATSGDYEYRVLADGTAEITKYTGSAAELTIPSEIDGYRVTSIGYHAFYNCKSLTSITIPDSVTSIGEEAFYNLPSLINITIPDSVTSIGKRGFSYCTSLTSITIPDSVTSIGDWAFEYCKLLTSIIIPDSVTNIGINTFNGCTSLASITIPNSVTSINEGAFNGCTSLTSITIPDSVTRIGYGAFAYCTSLANITIPDSVTSIKNWAFYDTSYYNDESNWDNGILYIGNHLIDTKSNISGSIEIKQGTKTIADLAFMDCTSLTSITIPSSVKNIVSGPFLGCSSLMEINVSGKNANYSSEKGILFNKDKTEIVRYPAGKTDASYSIPNSVTIIGDDGAFEGCTSLTSITIPDNVTSIGNSTFSGCTSLTSITIPNSVTSIGNWVFENCISLTSITVPESVTSIGNYAFYGCTSLMSITIPESVTEIGEEALGYYLHYEKIDGFIIYGFTGSEAERYAKNNKITFISIGGAPTVTFPDVANEAWYYNAIAFNVNKGYLKGYGNGNFGPGDNIQRQDFVVLLSRIAGVDLSAYEGQNGGFADVPTGTYFSAAVAWAKDKGILSGYADGRFGVGDPITREQACKIFYNYCNGSVDGNTSAILANYPDGGNVSDWAREYVAWAAENHVVGGNGTLNPAGNANRAEMAQIIMNMSNNDIL